MKTLNELARVCGLTTAETKNILYESGVSVNGDNDQIPESEINKVPAFLAKTAIHHTLLIGGDDCESIVKSKCKIIWAGCPDTRAEFSNDFSTCEAYYVGLARGAVNLGGQRDVH